MTKLEEKNSNQYFCVSLEIHSKEVLNKMFKTDRYGFEVLNGVSKDLADDISATETANRYIESLDQSIKDSLTISPKFNKNFFPHLDKNYLLDPDSPSKFKKAEIVETNYVYSKIFFESDDEGQVAVVSICSKPKIEQNESIEDFLNREQSTFVKQPSLTELH